MNAKLTIDPGTSCEHTIPTTLESVLEDGEGTLDPEELRILTDLKPGESYTATGGGCTSWVLTRID